MALFFALAVFGAIVVILVVLGVGAAVMGVDSRPGLGDENQFPEHHSFMGGSF